MFLKVSMQKKIQQEIITIMIVYMNTYFHVAFKNCKRNLVVISANNERVELGVTSKCTEYLL